MRYRDECEGKFHKQFITTTGSFRNGTNPTRPVSYFLLTRVAEEYFVMEANFRTANLQASRDFLRSKSLKKAPFPSPS